MGYKAWCVSLPSPAWPFQNLNIAKIGLKYDFFDVPTAAKWSNVCAQSLASFDAWFVLKAVVRGAYVCA